MSSLAFATFLLERLHPLLELKLVLQSVVTHWNVTVLTHNLPRCLHECHPQRFIGLLVRLTEILVGIKYRQNFSMKSRVRLTALES